MVSQSRKADPVRRLAPVWPKRARMAREIRALRLRGEPSDDVTEFVNRNALNVGEPFKKSDKRAA